MVGSDRSLRRHVTDWVAKIQDSYPADLVKQSQLAKGIEQRLSAIPPVGTRDDDAREAIIESLQIFYRELDLRHSGR